jgi:malate dehydrogenase (oxaloacetate-decarboxylating)
MRGEEILNNPLINKGTAFTQEERDRLGLNGLLPCHVSTIEEQVCRRYDNFCEQKGDLAKYLFLAALQNRNEVLFYRLVFEHVAEMLPYIYTPTVGEASSHFSLLYTEHRGLYLSYPDRDKIESIVNRIHRDDLDVVVVTDGERILGLGDLGIGGMAIPVGKLSLYTLFGGIHPSRTLPVFLDVGTNNEKLLKDPLYLGWRHPRIGGEEYNAFVDRFVKALKARFPRVLLQWEDFAKPHAGDLLERYRKKLCTFNDDMQGTAAVVLAAILTGIKITRSKLADQRFVIFGGGTAGLGICNYLVKLMVKQGIGESEALKRIYVFDRHGLIHKNLSQMEPAQAKYARDPAEATESLEHLVESAKPTVLIGVSAQAGAFTEKVVRAMAKHTPHPMIFPLSNPTSKCEAHPHDVLRWTKGKAIVATGSPFIPFTHGEKDHAIPQCNNVYIYPGVGLGVIAAKSKEVTDEMFLEAADTLSDFSPRLLSPDAPFFPEFDQLRNISRAIALRVAQIAVDNNLAQVTPDVDATMWFPSY